MTWLYLLIVLVPLAGIGYIVWDFRRKTALRDAVRVGRLQELIGAGEARGLQAVTTAPAQNEPHALAPQVNPVAVRQRLLTRAQTLAYYLLKTGLPEHVVFAQVPLSFVLEPRDDTGQRQELSRRLAGHTMDFLVLDKTMRPLSAITLHDRTVSDANRNGDVLATWMRAAGLRYVELDASALPRKDAIRAVVLPS